MVEYRIKVVAPQNGEMRSIHKEILGSRCRILYLTVGQSCFMEYELRDSHGVFHRLCTSIVSNFIDDGTHLAIETANTEYLLERI